MKTLKTLGTLKPLKPFKANRTFKVGQRVAEVPRRAIGTMDNLPFKRGEIMDFRETKVKTPASKKGYRIDTEASILWDGRTVADWVKVNRVIHEHELENAAQSVRYEV